MSNNSPGNKQAMNIVQFPEPTNSLDNCFGVCPKCRRTDGSLNIGRDHWFFCDRHKTRWYIGSNLFSCWKEETEREWRQNFDKLAYYTVVKPYYGREIEQLTFIRPDQREIPANQHFLSVIHRTTCMLNLVQRN